MAWFSTRKTQERNLKCCSGIMSEHGRTLLPIVIACIAQVTFDSKDLSERHPANSSLEVLDRVREFVPQCTLSQSSPTHVAYYLKSKDSLVVELTYRQLRGHPRAVGRRRCNLQKIHSQTPCKQFQLLHSCWWMLVYDRHSVQHRRYSISGCSVYGEVGLRLCLQFLLVFAEPAYLRSFCQAKLRHARGRVRDWHPPLLARLPSGFLTSLPLLA
jgi:hypothetical protein